MALAIGKPLITKQQIGKDLVGKILRLYGWEAVGACELGSAAEFTLAFTFHPRAGDADFSEPVVVIFPLDDIEKFIEGIRVVQASIASVRKDGAA